MGNRIIFYWTNMLPWYKQQNGCFMIFIWRAGIVLWINSGRRKQDKRCLSSPCERREAWILNCLEMILENGFVYGKWLFQKVIHTKLIFWNLRKKQKQDLLIWFKMISPAWRGLKVLKRNLRFLSRASCQVFNHQKRWTTIHGTLFQTEGSCNS